jgi:hypothetical protein
MVKNNIHEVKDHFRCDLCNYETTIKGNYESHVRTLKHYHRYQSNKAEAEAEAEEEAEEEEAVVVEEDGNDVTIGNISNNIERFYVCDDDGCGKHYRTRGGLWKHRKICKTNNNPSEALYTLETNEESSQVVCNTKDVYNTNEMNELKYGSFMRNFNVRDMLTHDMSSLTILMSITFVGWLLYRT